MFYANMLYYNCTVQSIKTFINSSVSGLASPRPDKSFILNELNQSANLSMSVPDVGSNNNGKLKEPAVLMVEPYLQNSGDENTDLSKNEKG